MTLNTCNTHTHTHIHTHTYTQAHTYLALMNEHLKGDIFLPDGRLSKNKSTQIVATLAP